MAERITEAARNSDIECLRAIAVLGVVFHHADGNLFHPGISWMGRFFHHAQFWFGVDLFLAISGFVIARSLLPQMASAGTNVRQQARVVGAFWIRRFWRLIPSAWLWLAIMLLAAWLFNRSGAFGSLHANVMATVAGMLNVANFRFADAFFRYEYGASFVYWSLSLEEQFYLLLPLVVALVRRRLALLLIAVFLIQICLTRTPLLMSIRTDALCLGILLAIAAGSSQYAALTPRFLLRAGFIRVGVPLLVLAVVAMLASEDMQAWRFRISAIALLCAGLVWLASYDQDYLLARGLLKRLLVWIGARSYAIYLIHVPVYFALREISYRVGAVEQHGLFASPWLLAPLAAIMIVALADANYRYLEQPLRDHGRDIASHFMAGSMSRSKRVDTGKGAPVNRIGDNSPTTSRSIDPR